MSISREEILMGRDVEYPLDDSLEANLADLLEKVNSMRSLYGKPLKVSSGCVKGNL